MDAVGDDTDIEQGTGVDTASDDDHVVQGGGRGALPPVTAVFVAISRKRLGPRVPRPKLRRAVVRPAGGSDHGVRRSKEFMQWREWYLRKQRREKEEKELLYYAGIPPPAGSWMPGSSQPLALLTIVEISAPTTLFSSRSRQSIRTSSFDSRITSRYRV